MKIMLQEKLVYLVTIISVYLDSIDWSTAFKMLDPVLTCILDVLCQGLFQRTSSHFMGLGARVDRRHMLRFSFVESVLIQFRKSFACTNFSSTHNRSSSHLSWLRRKSWKDGCNNRMGPSRSFGMLRTECKVPKHASGVLTGTARSWANSATESSSNNTTMAPTIPWKRVHSLAISPLR